MSELKSGMVFRALVSDIPNMSAMEYIKLVNFEGRGWRVETYPGKILMHIRSCDIENNEIFKNTENVSDQPEWNVQGLPPVGCEVEYKVGEKWCKCEVLAIKRGKAVCWDDACGMSGLVEISGIRPIRTEAEKRREADLEVIIGLLGSVYDNGEKLTANQILDAGFTRGGSDD